MHSTVTLCPASCILTLAVSLALSVTKNLSKNKDSILWEAHAMFLFIGQKHKCMLRLVRYPGLVLGNPEN